MTKKARIVSYTAEDTEKMIADGKDETDWNRVDRMTEEELEKAIAEDPDEGPEALGPIDWSRLEIGLPRPKKDVHIRIDADILDWFKRQGKGYQTRINAVLRSYVEARRHEMK